MFSGWFYSKQTVAEEIKATPEQLRIEHLRTRAKELAEVDHSWRAKLECLGFESARKHAGFTPTEIADIELQQRKDRKELLQNITYLRKRSNELNDVDASWTAYFFGKTYARKSSNFQLDEINAITKQRETDAAIQRAKQVRSAITGIFFSDSPKEKPPIHREKTDAVIKKHAERKERLGLG